MATEKHTVNAADLIGYESHFIIASAHGNGISKQLKVIASLRADGAATRYFVDNRGRTKYDGASLAEAVAAYNAV
jgi:hypothetical protein